MDLKLAAQIRSRAAAWKLDPRFDLLEVPVLPGEVWVSDVERLYDGLVEARPSSSAAPHL